ncbi:XIAP-associated factor 1 [Echinops telfairi]|uniref:XIAP-associated factor 1 n=1 Tax=Echinops telfairi TaxID=9371 RepID=A0AC55DCI2_ECHTE|nr:XIAP-associated factor 1 [Echinops telfairi]
MEEDVQQCEHCKRSVASAHFALHEAHCMRFLVLCPTCEEPVPKKELKEHFEDKHMEVKCAMCRQTMQKYLLEVHEDKECQMRQVQCKFCELTMNFSKLEDHEYRCGSKTELCPDCNQFIQLRKLAYHKDTCQRGQTEPRKGRRTSAPGKKINCVSCNQMIAVNEYAHHAENGCPVSALAKWSLSGKPGSSSSALPSPSAVDQTPTGGQVVRPKTQKAQRLPRAGRSTPRSWGGKHKAQELPSKTERWSRPTSPGGDETAYDILRNCSRCDILLPLPTLIQHQEKCRCFPSSKRQQVRGSC